MKIGNKHKNICIQNNIIIFKMRTTSKSKSFIEVLDGYKSKKDLNYTDYLTVLSLINKSYNENIQPDNFMKFSSNYYSEYSSSI